MQGRVLILPLLWAGFQLVSSDIKFYRDSNAVNVADENLKATFTSPVSCDVTTSFAYLGETKDDILATFVGDFSISGPHNIGSFPKSGSTITVSVLLNTEIGKLQRIVLQKASSGGDQWLLSHIKCRYKNHLYELKGPRQWLNVGGIESDVQETAEALPAGDTLTIFTSSVIWIYTDQGLT
jgi:hypothetical protein